MVNKFLPGFIKTLGIFATKHNAEILLACGISGFISFGVLVGCETPKALRLIEEEQDRLRRDKKPPMKKRDYIRVTWKTYLPAAVTATVATGCLLGSHSANSRRNAALATAYALSETTLKEYKEKAVQMFGKDKEREIEESIAKDKIDQNPVMSREIIITDMGDKLFYDVHSDRYFKSDIHEINRAESELNCRIFQEGYISLNDFYLQIGLKPTSMGDDLGWISRDGRINLNLSPHMGHDGLLCYAVRYSLAPKYDFQRR